MGSCADALAEVEGSDRNPHVYQLAWCSRSRPAGREYAVGCGGPRSSPVCVSLGGASDAIAEEATCASLLGSPHFGNDTHGGSTTKMGIGEEAGESYGKTSFLPVLRRMLRVFQKHGRPVARSSPEAPGDRLRGVHTKEGEVEYLTVSHGVVPLDSFFCAKLCCGAQFASCAKFLFLVSCLQCFFQHM